MFILRYNNQLYALRNITDSIKRLAHLAENLTAEREVMGLIPGTRPILRVLKN